MEFASAAPDVYRFARMHEGARRHRTIAWSALAVALVLGAVAFACGGDGVATPPLPSLEGSPIPTAFIEPTATPVCDPEAPLPLPASFPSQEILTPEDYRITSIITDPHLTVIGRTVPPIDPDRRLFPHAVVGASMGEHLIDSGFTLSANLEADGIDYNFTAPDGRAGHFNSLPTPGCPDYVTLTIDLFWITPE